MNIEKLSTILTPTLLIIQIALSGLIFSRLNLITSGSILNQAQEDGTSALAFVEDVSADDDPAQGPVDAPITIIEFSDYQCPFCGQAAPVIKDLITRYPNKVRYVLRDFPLESIHPNAFKAAEAANCASDQNKYWEMHDVLFADQSKLEQSDLITHAEMLGLDMSSFNKCLTEGKYVDEIQKDIVDGRSYQVSNTPTVFINGTRYVGVQPDQIERAIKSILQQEATGS